MNLMFKELTEMEEMIKGNWDLKAMEDLMFTTKEYIGQHVDSYEKLRKQIE
jgi:hypothetical protein